MVLVSYSAVWVGFKPYQFIKRVKYEKEIKKDFEKRDKKKDDIDSYGL